MSLTSFLRGFRATTTFALTTALVLTPAVAEAAAKTPSKTPRAALTEAHGKAPAKGAIKSVGKRQTPATPQTTAASDTGLGDAVGLGPTMQLAAMTTGIAASPAVWAGNETGCKVVTPLLASQPGSIMAGNFRDADANCYVWLNLQQSSLLTGSEICKTALHEMGHLNGLQHSQNPLDIMFAPFRADPIPPECQAPAAPIVAVKAKPKGTAAATRTKMVCPPGATNADYCQAAQKPKAKTKKK
jgi:hypothetical protein